MTFWEACEKAKAIARGGDDTDAARRPATLAEALQDYGADLRIRGAGKANATVPLPHLSPAMLATPVALLTTRELKSWRNSLTKMMKASSANRVCKNVRAALNLAARTMIVSAITRRGRSAWRRSRRERTPKAIWF